MVSKGGGGFLFSGLLDPYWSKRDGNKVFLAQRGQNKFDRFLKLFEIGTGANKGFLVISKGHKVCGWVGFAKYAREMMVLTIFAFALGNLAISVNQISPIVNGVFKVNMEAIHRDTYFQSGAPYLSTLLKPSNLKQ